MTTQAAGVSELRVERHDGYLATVTINRPPNNFIDVALVGALADVYAELEQTDCRAIVLRSEGRHFSAGADFSGASAVEPVSVAGAGELYAQAIRLFRSGVPVVAAVQGAAVGGGAGLALSADLRVGCESTRFVFNFAALGIHQGFGISVTLPALVGRQRALQLLLTAKACNGRDALSAGLCDQFAPTEYIYEQALELAAQVAAQAPLAVRSIRATVRGEIVGQLEAAMRHEFAQQSELRATADHVEGIRAAAARETPRFTGA